jgi:diguanylate cyclase (GGDEF)-like protein
MMIATGLAVMRALSPAARKARMYRNPPLGGKPIRLVNLVEGKVAFHDKGQERNMPKAGVAKADSGRVLAPPRARAAFDERQPVRAELVRGGTPSRSVPMELITLLGEIERLNAALKAEQARAAALEASADTDALTEVFNRRGFDRELRRTLAYIKRYWTRAALIYIDLDGFKPVNDRHGHAAGDAILKAIAATLIGNVRASDTVARLGGDEFAVILWNLSEADAAAKAIALEEAVAQAAVIWEAETLSVGASIGLSMLGPDDELADALAKADRAMYARKARRKGNILPPRW